MLNFKGGKTHTKLTLFIWKLHIDKGSNSEAQIGDPRNFKNIKHKKIPSFAERGRLAQVNQMTFLKVLESGGKIPRS